MLKFLAQTAKTFLFIIIVLIFGQLVFWNGRSISDHIKVVLNSTQGSRTQLINSAQKSGKSLIDDAREAVNKQSVRHSQSSTKKSQDNRYSDQLAGDHSREIDPEAREQLNRLIDDE